MPELIRRLILAYASDTKEFTFPVGDRVAAPGWDGRLNTPVVSNFFPEGISGWEMGTKQSPQKKAEDDYKKRTADSLGFPMNETTFVFVTPHPWEKRFEWMKKKRAEGIWKDVRVINVDDLVLWLNSTPVVAQWLAHEIGKVLPGGTRALEAFWEEWSVGTNPAMTPGLVISGRAKDSEDIQRWITGRAGILEVEGDAPEESFAFLYASIATLSETAKSQALARCAIVDNAKELSDLVTAYQNHPLIIAAPSECIKVALHAVSKGHHVFIALDAKAIGVKATIRLSRPQIEAVEKFLRGAGLTEAESQRIARDSGRSLPVLRRQIFQSNAINAPGWADAGSAQTLIPVLLAGAWDENKEGDRQRIELLSGISYADFAKAMSPLLSVDDSPIRKVGAIWMLKSPLDAWFLLARHITDTNLKLFRDTVLAVLTKVDPKYDLPSEERWAAAVHGKSVLCSEWLRMGLAESLVLLSVYSNRASNISSPEIFSENLISEIFSQLNGWEAWASLKDVTPLLGEAAPDVFMEAIESTIAKDPKIIQELMKDDAGLFGECRHSGLLWALEGIAWDSKYFSRAVSVLGQLASIDTGGRWSNRPINSLKDIFLLGCPQTYATPEERLNALDILITKHPKMVWEFVQGYFRGGSFSESHKFRWRNPGGTRKGLDPEDTVSYQRYKDGLLPRLVDLAVLNTNIISASDGFVNLPDSIKERFIQTLTEADPNSFSREERIELLDNIREALNWINSYGDEEQKKSAPGLSQILERFTADDVIERLGWLLTAPWPHLPEGEPDEYEAKSTAVKKAQEAAAREILDQAALDKILEFASTIQYPAILGVALGKVVRDEKEDAEILDVLVQNIDQWILIMGYSQGRIEVVGPHWIDTQIERMKSKGNLSSDFCALLYSGLPEGADTWAKVGINGKAVEDAYWKRARGFSQQNRTEDGPIAVEKLLDVERPNIALEIAGDPKASIPSSLLKRLLEALLSIEGKTQVSTMDEYHLAYIFKQLYEDKEVSIEELARLEFPFAALFEDFKRYISAPMALHRLLQKDPLFFSQLVSFISIRDDRAPDPNPDNTDEETLKRRALAAHKVLDSWHLMPGLQETGELNKKELVDWIDVARKYCSENGHGIGGDLQIGFMLARSPVGEDGYWPHAAVRDAIEHLGSRLIEEHIEMGVYNSRGVVSRGLDDGGRQERDLVERYQAMSDALKSKWPRTAAMLRSLARSYTEDAKRHDLDADLRNLRRG